MLVPVPWLDDGPLARAVRVEKFVDHLCLHKRHVAKKEDGDVSLGFAGEFNVGPGGRTLSPAYASLCRVDRSNAASAGNDSGLVTDDDGDSIERRVNGGDHCAGDERRPHVQGVCSPRRTVCPTDYEPTPPVELVSSVSEHSPVGY